MNLERQSFLGVKSEALILNARVAIVGLCGGGSHVAQQLAHVGVGHFLLIDPDTADDTNLNRMVGLTAKDVDDAALKTDVIKRVITAVNPNAIVQARARKWQLCMEELKEVHAIFGCVDSFSERDQLEKFCRRFLIPYIDIGMDVYGEVAPHFIVGQVILSLPDHPCMRCMGFLNDAALAKVAGGYGAAGGKPQVVWPNGVLASVAVGKFMAMLTPWGDVMPPLFTEYDGNRVSVRSSMVTKYLGACHHFQGPNVLGDVEW
jgi:hypothetical protein